MFDFLDFRTIAIIVHVFGAILGAGGAFMSDGIFFSTMKDGRISRDEMRFLRLGSRMVWIGIGILIVSGAAIVARNPEFYLTSDRFLAKMSIVGVIIGNGLAFHMVHIPRMQRNLNRDLALSPEFVRGSALLVASGGISVVSWISTVVLGMLSYLPYSYWQIMAVYIVLILGAAAGAVLLRKKLLHLSK